MRRALTPRQAKKMTMLPMHQLAATAQRWTKRKNVRLLLNLTAASATSAPAETMTRTRAMLREAWIAALQGPRFLLYYLSFDQVTMAFYPTYPERTNSKPFFLVLHAPAFACHADMSTGFLNCLSQSLSYSTRRMYTVYGIIDMYACSCPEGIKHFLLWGKPMCKITGKTQGSYCGYCVKYSPRYFDSPTRLVDVTMRYNSVRHCIFNWADGVISSDGL